MSRFYFDNGDPDSQLNSDDETTLPFPAPLSRASFATSDEFSPSDFLTSLSSRHQTLEDLREELRGLSSTLNNELLDLVNANYSDFLDLGSQLKGGDERVEEVRLGLLGFQREIEGLREGIDARRAEMKDAIAQKKDLGTEIALGRRLLEVNDGIADLEQTLLISGDPVKGNHVAEQETDFLDDLEDPSSDEGCTSDEDGETATNGDVSNATTAMKRLRRHAEKYQILRTLTVLCGLDHPFVQAQQPRLEKIRSTLLLDLQNLQREDFAESKAARELALLENVLSSNHSIEIPIR